MTTPATTPPGPAESLPSALASAPTIADPDSEAGPMSPWTEALPKYADALTAAFALIAPSLMVTEKLSRSAPASPANGPGACRGV